MLDATKEFEILAKGKCRISTDDVDLIPDDYRIDTVENHPWLKTIHVKPESWHR